MRNQVRFCFRPTCFRSVVIHGIAARDGRASIGAVGVCPNCPPLSGTYGEPICRLCSPCSPVDAGIVNGPLFPTCYHLFFKLGIKESQWLGPDLFLPHARTRASASPAGFSP